MNTEEDEFRRIEREAKRRAQDDDDDTQVYVKPWVGRGSQKDQDIAYGMEIVYFDLIDLIEGKK